MTGGEKVVLCVLVALAVICVRPYAVHAMMWCIGRLLG
jgi:hypothetical protein